MNMFEQRQKRCKKFLKKVPCQFFKMYHIKIRKKMYHIISFKNEPHNYKNKNVQSENNFFWPKFVCDSMIHAYDCQPLQCSC
jgi:hypothetical protein